MTGCGGLRSAQLTVLEFLLLVSSDVSIMYEGTSVHVTIFFLPVVVQVSSTTCACIVVAVGSCTSLYKMRAPIVGVGWGTLQHYTILGF